MKRSILYSICLAVLSPLAQLHAQDQPAEALEPAPAPPQLPAESPQPPPAPTPPPKPKAAKREVISVTGSRIKRTDVEGPAPVQVVDKQQMEASGFNTVGDVLRELPVSAFGAVREEAGRGGAGVAGANLRGIGEEYTLVLIDGRRMPSDPVLEVVDIGEIPVAMVERIEILKEGASALYGSDAVGGVINIITRNNLDGAGVLYSRTFTAEKGGEEQRIELVAGTGTDRTNVTIAASYRDKSIIMARDRPYSANGWSSSGNPGSFVPLSKAVDAAGVASYSIKPGTGFQPDPNCLQSSLSRITSTDRNSYCEFNYAKTASNSPALNQVGLMAKFDHELSKDVKLFGFVKDSRRSIRWNYAPAPQRFDITDKDAVTAIKDSLGAAGAQIDPDAGDGIRLLYRTVELGTREQHIQEKNTMGVVGFNGTVGDWDWEYSFSKGRTWRNEVGQSGYWSIPEMQELIRTKKYNPLDPNRDLNALNSALHKPWSIETSSLDTHNLIFTGSVAELSGGPLGIAVGASYVEERYSITADNQTLLDEVAGSSSTIGSGERDFKSIFAETSLPLSSALELGVAARFDDYNDVGTTTNPRLSVKYKFPNLLLRASVGTGFRAPSLQTVSDDGGYGYPSFIDATACAEAEAGNNQESIDQLCSQQQYEVRTAAATDLEPEKTLFGNIGAVFEPGPTFNLGTDLWMIQIKDRIGIPDYNLLTRAEQQGNDAYKNAGIEIVRDGGEIFYITMPKANLAKTEVSGVDLNWNLNLGDRSSLLFNWGFDTTYYLYFKESVFAGQELMDRIGIFGRPRWKANNAFTFTFIRDHSVGATIRTIGGTEKAYAPKGDLPIHNEMDMQYTYSAFGNGTVSVGALNVLNRKPPEDESQNPTVDSQLYNSLGQSAYIKLTQAF